MRDLRIAFLARTQVHARVVEPGRVDVVPGAAGLVARKDPVAAVQISVIRGQVGAEPAFLADRARTRPSVPPDIVAAFLDRTRFVDILRFYVYDSEFFVR